MEKNYTSTIEFYNNRTYFLMGRPYELWNIHDKDTEDKKRRGKIGTFKRRYNKISASVLVKSTRWAPSPKLLLFGTANKKSSQKLFINDPINNGNLSTFNKKPNIIKLNKFYKDLKKHLKRFRKYKSLKKFNVQAATARENEIIFVSSTPHKGGTFLFSVSSDFFFQNNFEENIPFVKKANLLMMSATKNYNTGWSLSRVTTITGLAYAETSKILFISGYVKHGNGEASSYIGYIKNFDKVLREWDSDRLDVEDSQTINLTESNEAFEFRRIEGIALKGVNGNTHTLQLISNEGRRGSRIFTVNVIP